MLFDLLQDLHVTLRYLRIDIDEVLEQLIKLVQRARFCLEGSLLGLNLAGFILLEFLLGCCLYIVAEVG